MHYAVASLHQTSSSLTDLSLKPPAPMRGLIEFPVFILVLRSEANSRISLEIDDDHLRCGEEDIVRSTVALPKLRSQQKTCSVLVMSCYPPLSLLVFPS